MIIGEKTDSVTKTLPYGGNRAISLEPG